MTTTTNNKLVTQQLRRLKKLNKEQARIAWSNRPAIEVLAYAGTGKTTTAVAQQDRLMLPRSIGGKEVQAQHFLALASTNATTEILEERLAPGTVVKTVHALALSVTASKGVARKVLTAKQELKLLRQAADEVLETMPASELKQGLEDGIEEDAGLNVVRSLMALVVATGGRARKIAEEPGSQFAPLVPYLRIIGNIKRRLDELKIAQGVQTFADMIGPAVKAIDDGHKLPFRHLIVDEWQDITPDQALLIRALAVRMKTVLVLGDPYQSVFGFAGASYTPLAKLLPGTKLMRLTQSHRFKGRIAKLATAILRQGDPKLPSVKGREPGGHRPSLIRLNRAEDQAPAVVANIKKRIAKDGEPNQIVVLGRTKAQATVVERALLAAGINTFAHYRDPYAGHEKKVLRLMAGLEKMLSALGDCSAKTLGRHQVGADLKLLLNKTCPAAWMEAKAIGECVRKLKWALKAASVEDQYKLCGDVVLKRLGGKQTVGSDAEEEIRRWEPSARTTRSRSELRDHIKGVLKQDPVHLSTIHKAKGDQWDNVLVLNVVQGGLPHYRSTTAQQLEQERNLFYVAVTRARLRVYVYAATCFQPRVKDLFSEESMLLQDRETLKAFKVT